jgi:hypothetical protein
MWRKLIGIAALTVVAGAPVFAQVIPKGALAADKPVVMDGKLLGTTSSESDLALAIDPAKPYVVLRDSCSRYEIVLKDSPKHKDCEKENQERTENGCRRCEVAGFIIDGTFQPPPTASTMSSGTITTTSTNTTTDGGGFAFNLFGFGGGKLTTISNAAETAIPTIQDRADAANYNPGGTIAVDERGAGGGFGGGVDLTWGGRLGARMGFTFETERRALDQTVDIFRTQNGLSFNQNGDANIRAFAALVGATLNVGRGLTITGGPAVTWWNIDHLQTGSLRALCPNPCQTVRTDNVASESSGTDLGFHVGAEFYPGNGWAGFQALFVRTTYRDVYDPTAALAWPGNWNDNNLFLGVILRTTTGRR